MRPKELDECFTSALKDEERNRKHKGLLIVKADENKAKDYIKKAKINIELCSIYKERGIDYKIPEEWFYTLYYCALAILSKFGIESRSQRCTALFLKYLKNNSIINYDNEFIDRIMVYKEKEETSDVDKREKARYSSLIKSEEVSEKYEFMTNLCKRAIDNCEIIVYQQDLNLPKEIINLINKNN